MSRSLEFAAGIKPSLAQLAGSAEPTPHPTRIEAVGDKHVPVCARCGPVGGHYDTPGAAVQGAALHQRNQRFGPDDYHHPHDDED